MLKGLNYAKSQTDKFHTAFGHPCADKPTMLTPEQVQTRINFIAEELVEALAVVSTDDNDLFSKVTDLIEAVVEAEKKESEKGVGSNNPMVDLVDALTDINVFTQGTFSMMGITPQEPFDIVMDANMAKLGPDGKPIYRESDGKIMKPDGWAENHAPEPRIKAEVERQIDNRPNTKYKVGSQVKVREDLETDKLYSMDHCGYSDTFVEDMEKLKGKIVTIGRVASQDNGQFSYLLKEEKSWNWTDEMFEDLIIGVDFAKS